MADSFRAARWIRTLNLALQAVLFLTFIGGVNYLARSHSMRYDLTRYRRFSLSAETLAYLRELPCRYTSSSPRRARPRTTPR